LTNYMSDYVPQSNTISKQNLKTKFKRFFSQEFFHSGMIQWSLIGSIIVSLANLGVMVWFMRPVDFPVVLHYNVYFGVDMVGKWWQAYFLPFIGFGVLAVNTTLGYLFYKQKERIVAHLLLLAALVVQIAVSIAVASIIMINY